LPVGDRKFCRYLPTIFRHGFLYSFIHVHIKWFLIQLFLVIRGRHFLLA
jgi:hypothetical protein